MKDQHWGDTNLIPLPQGKENTEVLVKEPAVIETVNNRIYFYSDIDREGILKLNREIASKASEYIARAETEDGKPPALYLHINSYGGSIFAGLAGMDEIINSKIPITTVVDGCCASAATFLSVAGKTRLIKPHAFMLIHQLQSAMWGKYQEFQDEMQNLDRLMITIKAIYKEFTKVPPEKIDEILKHDLWFDAPTCVKYGLADEIV